MAIHIVILWALLGSRLNQTLKHWTKPTTASFAVGILADMARSRSDLVAKNAMLRQQLIVLRRQVKRPKLTNGDRIRLVLLAHFTRYWQNTLHIVQPDTLLRWHRDLFRLYWRRKSRKGKPEPRIPQETIDLIKEMAAENRLWGAERIRGELLKLGVKISKRTVQRYLPKRGRNSCQTWATFLRHHTAGIWACDFTVIHDLLFRPLYIFLIIELKTRRIGHAAVTRSPTDNWAAQQLREATPWDKGPRYLIRDRDKKYGFLFSAVARSAGIRELKTPVQSPRANAVCERLIGSLKRECVDHMLILNRQQLQRTVKEYVGFYNHLRPHQGLRQHIPDPVEPTFQPVADGDATKITSTAILGGLHHSYSRAPNLH
jgi:transposase InsO family protein